MSLYVVGALCIGKRYPISEVSAPRCFSLGFVDSRCGHVSPFVAPGARARPGRPWACGGADRGPADDSRTRIQMRSARIAPALLFVRAKARIRSLHHAR